MKPELKKYYDAALNKTEFDDPYVHGMWKAAMLAIRTMGDEILRLEKELKDIENGNTVIG